MCNRKALLASNNDLQQEFGRYFRGEDLAKLHPHYMETAYSHEEDPVVANQDPGYFSFMHWGLVPFWIKSEDQALKMRGKTINAKCETLLSLPSFRFAARKRRCLIPCSGFFEHLHWNTRTRIPFYIYLPGRPLFSFGGIWDAWRDPRIDQTYYSYSVITVPANPMMERIHNTMKRMPLILSREQESLWLQDDLGDSAIAEQFRPYDQDLMDAYPVSKLITSRSENPDQPAVLERMEWPELKGFRLK